MVYIRFKILENFMILLSFLFPYCPPFPQCLSFYSSLSMHVVQFTSSELIHYLLTYLGLINDVIYLYILCSD